MIKQLVITFFLVSSLLFFSSCTIFGLGDSEESAEAEDYYSGEDEYADEEAGELISDQDQDLGETEDAPQEGEESDLGMSEEDIQYIDEEDEEFLAEEGENIEVEDDEEDSLGGGEEIIDAGAETSDSVDQAYNDGSESSSFFQSDAKKTKPRTSIPAKKQWISYKKIKSQPYNTGGFLVNAVYIARPGENIQGISNKIFNSDQVNQLYAINPHLKARDLKVGDKIYYQSPNRPQDSSQILFYFEDNGMSPSYHQIQVGENIRTIASQLLGHTNSWKEIWATNPHLDSKGVVNESINIKYWLPGTVAQAPIESPMETESPPPADTDTLPSPPLEEETPNVPPDNPMAEDDIPVPPSDDEVGDSEEASPGKMKESSSGGGFSQMDMTLAGVLALGALICAFMIIKKRRKKKEFDYTAANFEIDE